MTVSGVGQADCGNDWPAEDGADKDEDLEGVNCLNCTPKARLFITVLPAREVICGEAENLLYQTSHKPPRL